MYFFFCNFFFSFFFFWAADVSISVSHNFVQCEIWNLIYGSTIYNTEHRVEGVCGTKCFISLLYKVFYWRLCIFCVWTNVKSASSPFAQSPSHAKAQQQSDNLPQQEMHKVHQSMTRGWLYRFFNGVVITKSSIDMYCTWSTCTVRNYSMIAP